MDKVHLCINADRKYIGKYYNKNKKVIVTYLGNITIYFQIHIYNN